VGGFGIVEGSGGRGDVGRRKITNS